MSGNATAKTLRYSLQLCLFLSAICLSHAATALEFQCEVPNDTRYLRVEIPGQEHLCEVSVSYLQSGVREVKWHARNDSLFCSARAYELRDKYEQLWDYTCTTLPDRDGIDILSPSQRSILDQRLKSLIEQGRTATPPFSITGIKAVASNPLDNEPGKIAFQYFSENTDFTEIIDDQSDSWQVNTTINDMASLISGDLAVSTALVHSISTEGNLEIHTQLVDLQKDACFGTQILTPVGNKGVVRARTPHRFVCNIDEEGIALSTNDASALKNTTADQ